MHAKRRGTPDDDLERHAASSSNNSSIRAWPISIDEDAEGSKQPRDVCLRREKRGCGFDSGRHSTTPSRGVTVNVRNPTKSPSGSPPVHSIRDGASNAVTRIGARRIAPPAHPPLN